MANVKTTNVWIQDSIHLFLSHWKYGKDYEDSSILVDPSYNIIWFFDRKTENIDVIMADLPHPGWFIIADGVWFNTDGIIKYIPYDYEMARAKWKKDSYGMKKKDSEELWEKIYRDLKDYNINYFDNVKNDISSISIGEGVPAFKDN